MWDDDDPDAVARVEADIEREFLESLGPFVAAAAKGDLNSVTQFLDAGVSANSRASADSWSALHAAAVRCHPAIVRLLLERGADMEAVVEGIGTPLANAAGPGCGEVVRLLLDAGADVNSSRGGDDGTGPISSASEWGNATVLAMLLDAGADPNETSADGVTALMDAAESGDPECVKLLLEAGADPRPSLSESRGEFAGYGAADLARRLGHSESADLLDRALREWRDVGDDEPHVGGKRGPRRSAAEG